MLDRRAFLQLGLCLPALPALAGDTATTQHSPIILRAIPSSGERIPVIGMGTSRTFDTDASPASLDQLRDVMRAFLAGGGTVIDSSPMYGQAEQRVGDVLADLIGNGLTDKASTAAKQAPVFAATKVWTNGKESGVAQMEQSAQRMAVNQFGLVAVHNLRDWRTHLPTLRAWKEQGRIRHIGITTSHGLNHPALLEIMRSEPLDFVQFSYNIANRQAERELLPLAQERGIATMINRPFARGELFSRTRGKALPAIARDIGVESWAQFFLKFIIANSAVTCVIPASAKPLHMADNMRANVGEVPSPGERTAMLRAFEAIA